MIQPNHEDSGEATEPNADANVERPGLVSRSCYSAGYYFAYGVAFPTLLVASVLPTDNALGHGLADGGSAAKDASQRANRRICDATSAVGKKAGDGYAGVASSVQGRVEAVQDKIAERRYRRRIAPA